VGAAACEREMQLVQPDGMCWAARTRLGGLRLRPALRPVAWLMGLPGLRQLAAAVFGAVAASRYRLGGRIEATRTRPAPRTSRPRRAGPLGARALVRDPGCGCWA
jgi:hypothetical protein